MRFVGLIF